MVLWQSCSTREEHSDCRCMSMPVWEEQQLGNFSHGYPPQMPFKAPLRAATHSALYLSLDAGGDQLVGRAENGKPSLHSNAAFCMCHL